MQQKAIQLDIEQIIKIKAPRFGAKIPAFVYRYAEKLICQERMNYILRTYKEDLGSAFATSLLKELHVTLRVEGLENIPAEGRFIFASNHPLGGLDGVALVSLLGPRYNDKVKVVVNDLLMFVSPLAPVFLPINKYGSQDKEAAEVFNEVYNGDDQIVMFPAGMVSRLQRGVIADQPWKKAVITKSISSERDVIPVYFGGTNSSAFYRLARLRKFLRFSFNVEMTTLPKEMFKNAGKEFVIRIGKPISYTTFDKIRTREEWAQFLREKSYELKK